MSTLTSATRLGPRELQALESVQRSGRAVVRLDRDRELFRGFSANALRLVLKGLADGGWLRRLERGAYVVAEIRGVDTRGQLAIVADWLEGEPYVVSGFFALAHWNLTAHPPTRIDILMPRRKKSVRYARTQFRFVYVPRARLPMAKMVNVRGARASARIVTAEGALTSVLAGRYATSTATAREAFQRGLRYGVLNRTRLWRAIRDAPPAAARRLGWIADACHDPLADRLASLVGNDGYLAVDPSAATTGAARNAKWRVLENADPTE